MTFLETFAEYWPSMLIGSRETGIMMPTSMVICLLAGLPLGLGLFLANPKVKRHRLWLYWILNFIITVICSFPYLLFVIASIPVTRSVLGKAFGPVSSSVPLSIVAIVIFAHLIEQVPLDVPEEIYFLANPLGTPKAQYIQHFLLVEARSGLVLAYTTTTASMVPYSMVMDVVDGGGIGDFVVRVGYQRYEYGIMYVAIAIVIAPVFILQMLGNFIAQKLDKRKQEDKRTKKSYSTIFAVIAAVILAACGGNKQVDQKEDKEITAAVQLESSKDVLEIVKKEAERKGYKINTMKVSDNVVYNGAVQHDEADANFAQHQSFMEMFNEEKKADLVVVRPIYHLAGGFYSKECQGAKDLPENTKVGISSDPTNEGRALAILNANGVIKLRGSVGFNGAVADVVENLKNITFESIDLLNLAKAYGEKDIAMVFYYPACPEPAGLTTEDAILLEDKGAGEHHVLQVVTRKGEKDSEKIKVLKEAMTTKEAAEYIKKNSKGANIFAF